MMSTADPTPVKPPTFGMAVVDVETVTIDFTPDLGAGQAVSSVSATMTNVDTGATITLTHSLTVTGNVVSQTFDAPADGLVAGEAYRYRVLYTAYPTGNKRARDLRVLVSA